LMGHASSRVNVHQCLTALRHVLGH
jgi:hypothetical protein